MHSTRLAARMRQPYSKVKSDAICKAGTGSQLSVAMKDFCRQVGALSGRFEYAEGWRPHNPLGFCDASADPLCDALGALVLAAD